MKCQHNGYYELVVYVEAKYVKHAEEQDVMFGAADYIQGILNMALLRDLDRTEELKRNPPPALPDFDDDDPDARW